MKPTNLSDVLIQISPDAASDSPVPLDPDEVVTVFAGATETLKVAPVWTATLTGTRFAWGASTASGLWGEAVYS